MPVSTIDVAIRPEDGWVLVATNPSKIVIRPFIVHPWRMAISAGLPANTLRGVPFNNDRNDSKRGFEMFLPAAITGEVYIRIDTPPSSTSSSTAGFGIFRDQ